MTERILLLLYKLGKAGTVCGIKIVQVVLCMYGGGAAKETFKNGSGLIYQER
jgi:hypothetical protein